MAPDDDPGVQATPEPDWAARSATALGQLLVEVRVVMARRPLTRAESSALDLGQLLLFEQPPDGSVELRVEGRLLARGRLVDVEGRRGVRVTAIPDFP